MVNATIDVIDRGGLECDLNYLVQANTIGTHSEPNPDVEYIEIPVWNLVIDHPEATILWDTGNHEDALDGHWPEGLVEAFYPHDVREHTLEGDLEAAGWSLGDIDAVFQSHLHLDHAGGLHHFDGTDVPVYVHEEEVKYAYYSAKTTEGSGAYVLGDFDHNLNWQILHQDRESHFEDMDFLRLPGHTPGLTGTVIHLDDHGTIVFAGDEVYQVENYRNETPLGGPLLWSGRHWFESLQQLKELERKHDAEIVYGHDPSQFEEIEAGWS